MQKSREINEKRGGGGGFAEPAAGYYAPVRDTTLRAKSRAGARLGNRLLETLISTSRRSPFGQGTDGRLCHGMGRPFSRQLGHFIDVVAGAKRTWRHTAAYLVTDK